MSKLNAQRTLRTLVVATAMGLVLTSCTSAPDSDTSGPSAGHAITASYQGDIANLDPVGSTHNQTNQVLSTVYDPLMTFDSDNKLTGWLVSSYEYSSDAKSVVLTLQDGVTFHDGTEMTADDVKYSLDRYTEIGKGVAVLLKSYDSSEVTGPLELTVRLKKADSLFMSGLSRVYVVNAALVKRHAGDDQGQGWLSEHDAGSGPFALTSGSEAQKISAVRFADYWKFDETRPQSIDFRRIDLDSTQAQEVAAGSVDVSAYGLDYRSAQTLKGVDGINIVELAPFNQTYVFFNMVNGPTTDPAVRKAIQLAFDYEGALKGIQNDQGAVAEGVLPVGMPCAPDQSPYEQNLDLAKSTLVDAGVSNLSLTLRYQTFHPFPDLAALMQANLKEIGINLEIQPITFPEYLATLSDPTKIPEMMMLDDSPSFPDPGALLQTYHSSAVGTNRSGLSDPAIDKLLDEISATTDEAQRCELYEQVQADLREAAVSVNLMTKTKLYAARSNIDNVTVNRMGGSGVALADIRTP